MSYNHEPQFNTQSATVQDICDYLTMKREWLLYIEGYTDTFPDTRDYQMRFRAYNTLSISTTITRRDGELYNQAADYIVYRNTHRIDQISLMDEIEFFGIVAFSMYQHALLLDRYCIYRHDVPELYFEDDTLNEMFRDLRDDCDAIQLCNDCETYYLTDDMNYINGERICESCTENSYVYSEFLSEYIHNSDAVDAIDCYGHTVVIDGENPPDGFQWDAYHERWEHEDYEDRTIIGEYHSNRHSYYLVSSPWTNKNKRFFGVELEVEVRSAFNRQERARNIKEFVEDNLAPFNCDTPIVFERDGSLDNGFEIISQPMGLDSHKEIWKWTNESTITEGLRSHLTGTCGLHVHVSREGLTNLQIARAVYFVNHQANRHLIETVARRYNAGYCKAKSKKISTANRAEDRYEMINLQNRKTIEFRIFKGSLKYEAIISAIEFCHAVLNFAATNSNLHLSTEAFLKFIFENQNRADTATLRQYLMDRNPAFRKDFERLIKPEMKKLIPAPELIVTHDAETIEV